MAFSDMEILEPWAFRASTTDDDWFNWFNDALSYETQAITAAVSQSISGGNSDSDFFPPLLNPLPKLELPSTPAVSNVSSGCDLVPSPRKRQRTGVPVLATSGKVSKRRSRPSKRSQTTFITADPANFRQMVQQVTGIGCQHLQGVGAAILRPEPQKPGSSRFSAGPIPTGWLPTLDTSSAFLLNHSHSSRQQELEASAAPATPQSAGGSTVACAASFADGSFDVESLPSFPTLESWNDGI
ncbi:hypothetical protein SAY87_001362 [Trapa incisa]|uniref:VQ domain-containing protein n=1 Tax=Trapa incisa TaxID=236973 RepID=A0AAN7JAD7_9MYRT|nr:hypothetical protein SAY87_001362 [Trapa incisa]